MEWALKPIGGGRMIGTTFCSCYRTDDLLLAGGWNGRYRLLRWLVRLKRGSQVLLALLLLVLGLVLRL